MQCFLAVLQLGSVQRAADNLAITQPAVSKTIAELEQIVGATLFERGRHGATPTHQGLLFAPHARVCVSALRQAVDEVRRDTLQSRAPLVIGALPTVVAPLLTPALAVLRMRWPDVSVRVVTGSNRDLIDHLNAGRIGMALGRLSDHHAMAGMNFEHLCHDPLAMVVRVGHPLAGHGSVCAEDLSHYPVVVPPPGTLIRQSADSVLTAFGALPSGALVETLSVALGRALALSNDAVWFVPSSAIEDDVARDLLVKLAMPASGTDEPIGLIRRSDAALADPASALVDALREAGRERRTA